jgi:hypothetical protein
MTRRANANEVIGIFYITLNTFSSRQTVVTIIMLNLVDETFGSIMIVLTDTKIVFIIKTESLIVILTDMMISEDGWNRLINI